MGIQLSPVLAEAAAFCGVVWPGADEDSLEAAGHTWTEFAAMAAEYVDGCRSAVAYVAVNNEGPGTEAFVGAAAADDSGIVALDAFVASGPEVAAGFARTARVVATAKAAAAANLAAFAMVLAQARIIGPPAFGVLIAFRFQTRQRVDAIWERAAQVLREGS